MPVLYQLAPNGSVSSSACHGRVRTSAAMAAAAVVQPLPDQWVSVRQYSGPSAWKRSRMK